MTDSWMELGGAIVAGASIIAGALKLLARDLRKAIEKHGAKIEANTAALDRNTGAAADRPANAGSARVVKALLALGILCATLGGCANTDPLTVRSLERNREVWQEDRRADLDPELVKSRETEFDAQLRYENSKGGQ